MRRILYLHGFASSPASRKGQELARRFLDEGVHLEIPDLSEGAFRALTITRQLKAVERAASGNPVSLIGSSLGGYLAALYAARHLEAARLVLMAPAFDFARRWTELLGQQAISAWRKDGSRRFFHYATGHEEPLDFGFIEDAMGYEPYPVVSQPTLVLHGRNDDVVPVNLAREFAARNQAADLRIYDSDHQLLDVVDKLWREAKVFLLDSPAT